MLVTSVLRYYNPKFFIIIIIIKRNVKKERKNKVYLFITQRHGKEHWPVHTFCVCDYVECLYDVSGV